MTLGNPLRDHPPIRRFGRIAAALIVSGLAVACGSGPSTAREEPASAPLTLSLDDLETRTFRQFWDTASPSNGLVPDRHPTPSFASIAAIGFGLTAYPIGVERDYISRDAARERVLTTLRFLRSAPQGPAARGVAGYQGFFYHFLDMVSGERYADSELSTVDTALLMAGALFCQSYFDGADSVESEIRSLADELYGRVNWQWAQPRAPAIALAWTPEAGYTPFDWRGYNEAMIVYLLALGSPTFPVGTDAWAAWTGGYDRSWGNYYGQQHLGFPPMFGHQFTHVWVDFRGIRDAYMRDRGLDYFENSRRAVYAQRAYAIANPLKWKGYDAEVWGISASDGPADVTLQYLGEIRVFRSYAGRGMGGAHTYDDGTLAPTAAAASIAFAPEIAWPAVSEMFRRHGGYLYSTYGFLDAFNPSFEYGVPLTHGRIVPGAGWVDTDYLALDQGPIVAMIENYRSELIWRVMRRNPHLRRGLDRAGFEGGWLDMAQ